MKVRTLYGRANDRIRTKKLHARITREDLKLSEQGDPVCVCGWITGLDVCPNCGGKK